MTFEFTEEELDLLKYSLILYRTHTEKEIEIKKSKDKIETNYILELEAELPNIEKLLDKLYADMMDKFDFKIFK